jgi:hypothetical protein
MMRDWLRVKPPEIENPRPEYTQSNPQYACESNTRDVWSTILEIIATHDLGH